MTCGGRASNKEDLLVLCALEIVQEITLHIQSFGATCPQETKLYSSTKPERSHSNTVMNQLWLFTSVFSLSRAHWASSSLTELSILTHIFSIFDTIFLRQIPIKKLFIFIPLNIAHKEPRDFSTQVSACLSVELLYRHNQGRHSLKLLSDGFCRHPPLLFYCLEILICQDSTAVPYRNQNFFRNSFTE